MARFEPVETEDWGSVIRLCFGSVCPLRQVDQDLQHFCSRISFWLLDAFKSDSSPKECQPMREGVGRREEATVHFGGGGEERLCGSGADGRHAGSLVEVGREDPFGCRGASRPSDVCEQKQGELASDTLGLVGD